MKRIGLGVAIVVAVLALSPIWVFELAYGYDLLAIRAALEPAPTTTASELALKTLWVTEGERLDSDIRPLWVANYFENLHGDPHGSMAAYQVARARIGRLGFHGMLQWHLRTAVMTVWLTRHYSAAELQRALAAETYFGRGATGLDAAALRFFAMPVKALSPAQVALLVGLAQAPSRLDPTCFPERATKRRAFVLRRMASNHLISDEVFTKAMSEAPGALARDCADNSP